MAVLLARPPLALALRFDAERLAVKLEDLYLLADELVDAEEHEHLIEELIQKTLHVAAWAVSEWSAREVVSAHL